jgi:hypothetical protein
MKENNFIWWEWEDWDYWQDKKYITNIVKNNKSTGYSKWWFEWSELYINIPDSSKINNDLAQKIINSDLNDKNKIPSAIDFLNLYKDSWGNEKDTEILEILFSPENK